MTSLTPGAMFHLLTSARSRLSEGQKIHHWLVLSNPGSQGKALCVQLTSYRPERDTSDNIGYAAFILRKGDHPFIVRDTIPDWKNKLMIDVVRAEAEIEVGRVKLDGAISKDVLRRVLRGSLASGRLEPGEEILIQETLENLES